MAYAWRRQAAIGLLLLARCTVPSNATYGEGAPLALEPLQGARAAVVLSSCLPGRTASEWLDLFYRIPRVRSDSVDSQVTSKYSRAVSCLAMRSNGCLALGDCLSLAVERIAPTMPPMPACPRRCDGNVAERCEGDLRMRVDCTRFGLVCSPQTNNCEATPTLGTCVPSTHMSRCDGGRPLFCSPDGLLRPGARCSDYGLACVDGKNECQGTGMACAAGAFGDVVLRCENRALLRCVGEKTQSVDCSRVGAGFSCQLFGSAGGSSFCGTATSCSPESDVPRCDGMDLVVCNGGKTERVNCQQLGFMGCNFALGRCGPTVAFP